MSGLRHGSSLPHRSARKYSPASPNRLQRRTIYSDAISRLHLSGNSKQKAMHIDQEMETIEFLKFSKQLTLCLSSVWGRVRLPHCIVFIRAPALPSVRDLRCSASTAGKAGACYSISMTTRKPTAGLCSSYSSDAGASPSPSSYAQGTAL